MGENQYDKETKLIITYLEEKVKEEENGLKSQLDNTKINSNNNSNNENNSNSNSNDSCNGDNTHIKNEDNDDSNPLHDNETTLSQNSNQNLDANSDSNISNISNPPNSNLNVSSAVSRMGKRKYKDSISLSMFGTTTIAGRYKKMKPVPINALKSKGNEGLKINIKTDEKLTLENHKSKNGEKEKKTDDDILVLNSFTAGQCLVRLNFFQVLNDKKIIQFFSDSIKRRLAFENKKKMVLDEYENEVRRRKLEEINNLRMLRTQNAPVLTYDKNGNEIDQEYKMEIKSENSKTDGGGVMLKVVKEEVLDGFEELLGSPQDLANFNVQLTNNNNNNGSNGNNNGNHSSSSSSNGNNNNNDSNFNHNNSNNNGNNNGYSNNNSSTSIKKEKNTATNNSIKKEDTNLKIENNDVTAPIKKTKNVSKKPKIVIQMEDEE